jgi:4-hydroxy-3-methylbut-2-en-1-yl diphosphate synthase IspG/GcpE
VDRDDSVDLMPDTELIEHFCENEKDLGRMIGEMSVAVAGRVVNGMGGTKELGVVAADVNPCITEGFPVIHLQNTVSMRAAH